MDRYSRWVAFLKVLLPLAAVGLLSTLFLLSRKVDPEAAIPFADTDIQERLRNQQITAPTFAGVSATGDEIHVMATALSPPVGDNPARAWNISARLEGRRGRVITLTSDRGTLEDHVGRATLLENVVVETSAGYVLKTEELTAHLDRSMARAPGQVRGSGPLGEFQAGSMEMQPKNDKDGLHIVFKNGVRLIYEPKRPER